jgi:hypothetical protein
MNSWSPSPAQAEPHVVGGDLPVIGGVAQAWIRDVSVSITEHTVERWTERVKSAVSPDLATDDLVRCIGVAGDLRSDGPAWASKGMRRHAVGWVWIGDGIALPLDQQRDRVVAFTVVTCGGLGEKARALRSNRKRRAATRTPGSRGSGNSQGARRDPPGGSRRDAERED